MIKTTKHITEVKFGKGNKGTLVVGVYKDHPTTLTLQEIIGDHEIGTNCQKKDRKHLPKIEMEFFQEESIDVMIKALEGIKRNLANQYPRYYLAC